MNTAWLVLNIRIKSTWPEAPDSLPLSDILERGCQIHAPLSTSNHPLRSNSFKNLCETGTRSALWASLIFPVNMQEQTSARLPLSSSLVCLFHATLAVAHVFA